jgi:hypothetical protein
MSDKTWIEEQKENPLFRGIGHGGDAQRMLEKSDTNRYVNKRMAKMIIAARYLGGLLGVSCYDDLADMVESGQLCVDGRSRADFMKVAIEQWQGKINAAKSKITTAIQNMA